jgi:hypothetical protein
MEEDKKEFFNRIIKRMADCLATVPSDEREMWVQAAVLDVWKPELKAGDLEKLTEGFMRLINKELNEDKKYIKVPWDENEDDDIMVSVIDSALEYLDEHGNYFSEPIKVSDMRKWLREKLPSKFNTSEIKESRLCYQS